MNTNLAKFVECLFLSISLLHCSTVSQAASSFSAGANVGMGLEFPCSPDFTKNITQNNQLASATANAELDCSSPPQGEQLGVPFLAGASASAAGGRVRARSGAITGEDLAFNSLNANYPHGTATASFANDLRIRGPLTGKAQAVTLRFRLTGTTDLGSSRSGPGIPWGFSGVTINFGVTGESQASADDLNGPSLRFRDTFNFNSRSNANEPHAPVFELNLFITPGKNYLVTAGLSTFALGGALANYSNTGVLEEIIAPVGYTPEIDGIALRQEGARFVLADALPSATVNLSSSSNPSTQGQNVNFNASVTGNAPTGTIQFRDGAVDLGNPVALSGASAASFTTSALSVGDHAITAAYSGDSNNTGATSAVVTQTVNSASSGTTAQTMNFGALTSKILGDAPFGVSATASSGLPVSFSSQTSGICSVVGAMITISAAGACTIRASQAGDATYSAAAPVDQSFTVSSTMGGGSGGGGGCSLGNRGPIDLSFGILILLAAVSMLLRGKSSRQTARSC
jgi:Bacterial Ig-like domain (group 3)